MNAPNAAGQDKPTDDKKTTDDKADAKKAAEAKAADAKKAAELEAPDDTADTSDDVTVPDSEVPAEPVEVTLEHPVHGATVDVLKPSADYTNFVRGWGYREQEAQK